MWRPPCIRRRLHMELEERIEGHELNAGALIDFVLRHLLGEVALHGAVGVRVAVAVGESQQLAALIEEGEIAAPGVYADALELKAFGFYQP